MPEIISKWCSSLVSNWSVPLVSFQCGNIRFWSIQIIPFHSFIRTIHYAYPHHYDWMKYICSADGITYSFGELYVEFLHEFNEGKGYTSWILSLMCGTMLCSGNLSEFRPFTIHILTQHQLFSHFLRLTKRQFSITEKVQSHPRLSISTGAVKSPLLVPY